MAAISVSESRILVIQPWDVSSLKSIEKALQSSSLGVNPQNDGKVIRLIFPQITEEQRKNLAKDISKMAESYKIQVRNVRRDALDKLKKMKKDASITEDELNLNEKKIQKITDKFCEKIESLLDSKQKEIMTV
jgi:ribosome recycling factor